MLRPIHHLYLYVISAQKSHGLFWGYFLTAYAFQTLILLAFWRSFQRVSWHTKSTWIIVFSPLKLPWNAVFCKVLSAFHGIVVFFLFTTFFTKKCKMKQITSVCSSQIVVSLGGADYCSNKFPNLINLLISLKCSAKIFLHSNHLTALHEHPYPIL